VPVAAVVAPVAVIAAAVVAIIAVVTTAIVAAAPVVGKRCRGHGAQRQDGRKHNSDNAFAVHDQLLFAMSQFH
jgi:hypothetical protein